VRRRRDHRRNAARAKRILLEGGLLLATLVLLGSPADALAARPRDQIGNESLGDLRFHARAVPYRHGANEGRAEFSIRVPYQQMKFLPVDTLFEAKLRITVELKNKSGRGVSKQSEEARVQITDLGIAGDSLLGEIYSVGLAAARGTYRYRVTVEDLNVARRGLVYVMKNQKRQGVVEGEVDLGPWLFRNPSVSGITPAWSVSTEHEHSRFTKGPYEVLPQPSGYYGLFQDVFSAYYEIYDSHPPPGGRQYQLRSVILNAARDTVFTAYDSLRATEGTAWPHALAIDLSAFAAGHYWLSLELRSSRPDAAPASSVTEFDVLWQPASWAPYASDGYEVEAKVLLSNEESLSFNALPLGGKEAKLQELWRSVDPSPETAENEAYLEFLRRVQHANTNYTVFERGMFSDRGRVYLRYGEPDEVRIERLPVSDRTLGVALTEEIPIESGQRVSNRNSGVVDTRPFEIWSYNLRGNEIVPRRGLSETGSSLKFVFVDDQGYGDYILRYSSTAGMR
jgi:GWxTD domain-containing protein